MSAPTIRDQFALRGLNLASVDEAADEINRLIGLLRGEQNARLAAEHALRTLTAAVGSRPGDEQP